VTKYCRSGTANTCPQNSQSLGPGLATYITDCYCVAGYYGYTGIGGNPCAWCPANFYCPGGLQNDSQACPNGTFAQKQALVVLLPFWANLPLGQAWLSFCSPPGQ